VLECVRVVLMTESNRATMKVVCPRQQLGDEWEGWSKVKGWLETPKAYSPVISDTSRSGLSLLSRAPEPIAPNLVPVSRVGPQQTRRLPAKGAAAGFHNIADRRCANIERLLASVVLLATQTAALQLSSSA